MKNLLPLLLLVLVLQTPKAAAPGDRIAELQKKINSGTVKLDFDAAQGYLRSVLKVLNVPLSSQTLVFSKSSFQLHLIAPDRPRAMYFSDDVYVGWTRGGTDLELAIAEPRQPPVFYLLPQEKSAAPKFKKETTNCTACHDFLQSSDPLPRLLMLSVLPNAEGYSIGAASLVTNDQSPLRERWGGWYVTGKSGGQRHLGNMVVNRPASTPIDIKEYAAKADLSSGANITDLKSRFDTSAYLTPHSDIVALMVLGHQTHVHNMITFASADREKNTVDAVAEPLVRSLLFADAAPLEEPVSGTTDFAAEFASHGPKDSKGRSLRDLDLKTRLLRYPLSYLIYSESFNGMPDDVKAYVYRRIKEVLNGEDKSGKFPTFSEAERDDILAILRETKPDGKF